MSHIHFSLNCTVLKICPIIKPWCGCLHFFSRCSLQWVGKHFLSGSLSPSLCVSPSGHPLTAAVPGRRCSLKRTDAHYQNKQQFVCFTISYKNMTDVKDAHQTSCELARQAQKRVDLGDNYSQLVIINPPKPWKHVKIHINLNKSLLSDDDDSVNTYLDISQDCTTKCPAGICSLWPWEMLWEQRTCGIVR